MTLINIFPDWVFSGMIVLGAVGAILGIWFKRIPFIMQYQAPLLIVSIALMVAGVWYSGAISKDKEYKLEIAELQVKLAEAAAKSAEVNTVVEYVYQDRVEVVETIKYEVLDTIKTHQAKLNATCKIPSEAIKIHNRAASGENK